MSIRTHVVGVIRIDGITGLTPAPQFGYTCTLYSDPADWDKCNVPRGSEGSLQYSVWENPQATHASKYTVSVFGDLRDYDSVDEIVAYFNRISEGQIIRQGMFSVEVEGRETKNFIYSEEAWVEI